MLHDILSRPMWRDPVVKNATRRIHTHIISIIVVVGEEFCKTFAHFNIYLITYHNITF